MGRYKKMHLMGISGWYEDRLKIVDCPTKLTVVIRTCVP